MALGRRCPSHLVLIPSLSKDARLTCSDRFGRSSALPPPRRGAGDAGEAQQRVAADGVGREARALGVDLGREQERERLRRAALGPEAELAADAILHAKEERRAKTTQRL